MNNGYWVHCCFLIINRRNGNVLRSKEGDGQEVKALLTDHVPVPKSEKWGKCEAKLFEIIRYLNF
jgi:hypothetical protein